MRKKSFLLLLVIVILGMIIHLSTSVKTNASNKDLLISPESLSGKLATNLWLPQVTKSYAQDNAPEISARAAYFVDIDSGEILFQKNIHDRLKIASLTKIMTVIIALEHKSWHDLLSVSSNAAGMEPDHMELIAGEKLSLEELLDGVFLVSANDAAETLAEESTGNRNQFIFFMNQKALFLGMNDSLFINPSGLEEDGRDQYSSAYDVALMSRYAIKQFPHLVDISSQTHIMLSQTSTHQDYDMYSGINLLTTYPGVVGFKTGYTPEAGLTLVTLARRDGHQVLGILLGSENRREEAKMLLDYSFKRI